MEEMIPKKDLIISREAVAGDQAFIFSSFLKGLYYGNETFRQVDKTVFMVEYRKILQALLLRRTVKIACLKDSPDTIIGFSIYGKGVLDWVFVKPQWRQIGVAKDLIPVDTLIVTHTTKIGKSIRPQTWTFNPWSL